MTGMRFLLVIAMTLAAAQIAAAGDKKSSTNKTSTGGNSGIELGDYGFGVEKTTGKAKASSPVKRTGASTGKH